MTFRGKVTSMIALVCGYVAARGDGWRGMLAERARLSEGIQRLLLQTLGLKLQSLDLVAKRFLLSWINQRLARL